MSSGDYVSLAIKRYFLVFACYKRIKTLKIKRLLLGDFLLFNITPEKAEILGLLCAEGNYRGCIDTYFEKSKKRNAIYLRERWKEIIEFSNTSIPLLERFVKLLFIEYGYKPNIVRNNNNVFRVCITKNKVIRDLLRHTDFGCLKWKVPSIILDSNFSSIKSSFIRGFFDGDGSVDFTADNIPRIRFGSSNKKALESMCKLLDYFDFDYSLNGPYFTDDKLPSFELLIKTKSVKRFINLIGSNHSNKNIKFKEIIAETGDAEVDRSSILNRITR